MNSYEYNKQNELPNYIKFLDIRYIFPVKDKFIPETVTHLSFGNWFNANITTMISNITHLVMNVS
ncbi:hypothetical protein [Acanthamoeba polyphaga mimivirus]|uniref:F-box and FNIP repeat-containing n=1 Tax=Acanthamoeba polyphaga mimivirus TaxID=212035 RepID=A0A0G2Y0C5_MIMIV|nr:hypothetical protein [Acanthamoeba polyphaga mimivirus]